MGKYIVTYTIIKNKDNIPTGKYRKQFLTKYGASRFITELLYSKKRKWYKYARMIKSNI